ncbi:MULTISPECIES: hypothetical protein [Alphaproteobacteria]|jgi:hypothetical protein|uniref:Uncharacterized protein n=1 Tax=Sphingomonas psychrolutea TaxID=1259676 RepID=A0ABQ6EH26_9SPHN|nr:MULTISPECIES: hypothetical protein [Alphaproteobacteria]GLR23928.1 hypothetical protein GCM10007920_37220 [Ciceribacter naphthalenivorans]GLT06784.1 hypothetical protein GCM10007926_37220 [Sphingomonas psychrolutea]
MSISDSVPHRKTSRSRQTTSETLDLNGRPFVVVKKPSKDLWPLLHPTGQAGNPRTQTGKPEISDDEKDASVFRSWAMPEWELK